MVSNRPHYVYRQLATRVRQLANGPVLFLERLVARQGAKALRRLATVSIPRRLMTR